MQPVAKDAETTRVAEGNMERWAANTCDRRAKELSAGMCASVMRSRRRPSRTTTTTRRMLELPLLWVPQPRGIARAQEQDVERGHERAPSQHPTWATRTSCGRELP